MQVEPAHIDQIRCARDGRMVAISRDAGGVAEELRRIDPHLKVRFAEHGNPPFWAVYEESDDGRSTHLVSTFKAHQTRSGVWAGLDHSVVKHILSIDSRGGYDYVKELEKAALKREEDRRAEFRERVEPYAEEAAWALRKDLGVKNRASVPRDVA